MTFHPGKLLLADGLGALLSAVLLGGVVVRFASHFGMPVHLLYLLAGLACLFAGYSFFSFFRGKNQRTALRVIAGANLLYCGLTLALVVACYARLTALGCLYFGAEVAIILTLASLELKAAATGAAAGPV